MAAIRIQQQYEIDDVQTREIDDAVTKSARIPAIASRLLKLTSNVRARAWLQWADAAAADMLHADFA